MIYGIIGGIGLLVIAISICCWKDSIQTKQIQKRYKEKQATRSPTSDSEFCIHANLPESETDYVSRFRGAFASLGGFDPQKMYPGDNFCDFGISYDDDMAMFLSREKLLHDHPDYHYFFPLEEASDFASLIRLTLKINKEIEQGGAPNAHPRHASC